MLPGDTKLRLRTTGKEEMRHQTERVTFGHHLYHYGAFGATTLLFLLIAETRRQEWQAPVKVIGLATVIEVAQHLVYLSAFEWWDVRDDSAAAFGVFCIWRLRKSRHSLAGKT